MTTETIQSELAQKHGRNWIDDGDVTVTDARGVDVEKRKIAGRLFPMAKAGFGHRSTTANGPKHPIAQAHQAHQASGQRAVVPIGMTLRLGNRLGDARLSGCAISGPALPRWRWPAASSTGSSGCEAGAQVVDDRG